MDTFFITVIFVGMAEVTTVHTVTVFVTNCTLVLVLVAMLVEVDLMTFVLVCTSVLVLVAVKVEVMIAVLVCTLVLVLVAVAGMI